VAEAHLSELQAALARITAEPESLTRYRRDEFLEQARLGEITVLDVRPAEEYQSAHLPHARSMPLAEIEQRLAELPKDREIVAYCRGPFCLFSEAAVQLLTRHGFRVRKITDGVSEWQAAGMPLERGTA
jgi:rhodanese-related sulfurtransferase